MGKKKEGKPLLDKAKQQLKTPGTASTSTSSSVTKKTGKKQGGTPTLTSKTNLNTVRDDSSDSDDLKNSNTTEKPSTPTLQTVPESEPLATANPVQPGEEGAAAAAGGVDETKPCPMSYFGVKSYLHHFYETPNPQNTTSYEEDYHYLIRPKGKSIGSYLFKMGIIMGSTLFLMGAIAIITGYVIPRHEEIKQQTDDFKLVDRNAIKFNRNLDICKLIGLAGFCSGGLVLVISLLAPTFTSSYWDAGEGYNEEGFRIPITPPPQEDEPKSPIPATEKIKCIQPSWSE